MTNNKFYLPVSLIMYLRPEKSKGYTSNRRQLSWSIIR